MMMWTLGAYAVCNAQGGPLDYPQSLGRNRDGSESSFVQPTTWADFLTRRWHVEVGEGYASPLVVGDIIYVFSRRERREVLSALNPTPVPNSGSRAYAALYTPSSPTAAQVFGPKAIPFFHNRKIITLGITGIVAAFDAQRGMLLWAHGRPD